MIKYITTILVLLHVLLFSCANKESRHEDKRFVTYFVNPQEKNVKLYYKDENGANFQSLGNLKFWLEDQKTPLIFAMNGGMYKKDGSPQGLYIENHKMLSPLDSGTGGGNFYLKPNGVFYITSANIAGISPTDAIEIRPEIKFATQSGPMLLVDGDIHPAFQKNSTNLNIRNGVGILPDNTIVFAMSKKEINFYDFACYFKSLGCTNALYLDGLVSRTFLPSEGWKQLDGNFGVIIGITSFK